MFVRCFKIDDPFARQEITFTITDTKLYIPVVKIPTQNNAKLLEQLKSGLKRTVNWNKCHTKVTVEQQSRYLELLISPSFQGVNRFFCFINLKIMVVEQVTLDIIFR